MAEREPKNTLVDLTRAFISLLKEADGNEVELGEAEKRLDTSKRRLYDVANVLAGVGLVERHGKSLVRWVGRTICANADNVRGVLEAKERELQYLIAQVDKSLDDVMKSKAFEEHGWVTPEDVARLDESGSLNMFALRGPASMTIQVIDHEDGEHQLVCETEEGKIEVIPIENARH